MDFTPAGRDAIVAHAAALGQYIRRTAAERALAWQREREAFQATARRRGCTAEELVQRGSLTDVSL
jgi:hypothetical protein